MRRLIYSLVLIACSAAQAQEKCESVIALSKVVTNTVTDESAFKKQAANFCSDYAKRQGGNNSTNIGVSYGAISGSFGQSGASMEEIASKVCSSSDLSQADSAAYKNYVETISPNAYAAYQSCVAMTGSDMRFDVNLAAVLPAEFSITVGFASRAEGNSQANMAFSSSKGVACRWGNTAKDTYSIPDKGSVILKCARDDQTKPGYVKVSRTNGIGGELTIPWVAYSKEGVPVATLANMQKAIDQLSLQATAASTNIAGITGAPVVQVYHCPVGKSPGWSPGGAWGSYGCQGQISTSASCVNIEFPHTDPRACTPIGKLRLY